MKNIIVNVVSKGYFTGPEEVLTGQLRYMFKLALALSKEFDVTFFPQYSKRLRIENLDVKPRERLNLGECNLIISEDYDFLLSVSNLDIPLYGGFWISSKYHPAILTRCFTQVRRNGMIWREFYPDLEEVIELPNVCNIKDYNVERKTNTVLVVCRFDQKKRPLLAIKALEKVYSQYPKFQALVIGRSGNKEYSKKVLNKINELRFVSHLSELKYSNLMRQMQRAGLLIIPSIPGSELDPTVGIEAMGNGMAVVSINGHYGQEFTDRKILWNVNEGDCESKTIKNLAQAIQRLLENIEVQRNLGRNSSKFVKESRNLSTTLEIMKPLIYGDVE